MSIMSQHAWKSIQKGYWASHLSYYQLYECRGASKDKEILDIILNTRNCFSTTNYINIHYKETCFSNVKFYVFCTNVQQRCTTSFVEEKFFVSITCILLNIESFEFLEFKISAHIYPLISKAAASERCLYMPEILFDVDFCNTHRTGDDHGLFNVKNYIKQHLFAYVKIDFFDHFHSDHFYHTMLTFLKESNILVSFNLLTVLREIVKKRNSVFCILKENCKCGANFSIPLQCKCKCNLKTIYDVVGNKLDI